MDQSGQSTGNVHRDELSEQKVLSAGTTFVFYPILLPTLKKSIIYSLLGH